MSDKKCKTCGANAEWEFDDDCYCEFCACAELDVQRIDTPRICEMCGDALDDVYYIDGENTPFCSVKCALEYNDACEMKKDQADGREEEQDDECGFDSRR